MQSNCGFDGGDVANPTPASLHKITPDYITTYIYLIYHDIHTRILSALKNDFKNSINNNC